MAFPTREKFMTRVDSKLLLAVRDIARCERRRIQSLVDEALADLIEKHRAGGTNDTH